MDNEQYNELHSAIENADMEVVRRLLPDNSVGQYFSYEDTSALYKAFSRKRYEIASYLIHRGASIHASEAYDVYELDVDLSRVNRLLWHYNRKSEKSCVYRLMSLSQSPQDLDGDRLNALISMYERFFESDIIKSLMNVLEGEPLDIVYDFESDKVNRMHRLYEQEAEIFGLTLSNSREIFVGAKDLLSGDPQKRKKVYGVVAEELCHLALTTVFENDAKPYGEGNSNLIREFEGIVRDVKLLTDRACCIESVIKDVFEYYNGYDWECELIARVPHVIGINGEEIGRRSFRECPELSRLLDFYELNVHPKIKEFTDPSLNTKSHRIVEGLSKRNEFFSFREKQTPPLKEGFKSFGEYLRKVTEGISVIATNCTKLCALHVYHELKGEYGDRFGKECLFFTKKCFKKETDKILEALRGNVFEYVVLVVDEKELTLRRLGCEYTDHFHEFEAERRLKIVIISNSEYLGEEFKKKAVCYKWDDLSEDFQALRQDINYSFKGEDKEIYVRKEDVPKIFDEDVMRIISGELIKVNDGAEYKSKGYIPETYIDREFQVMTVNEKYLHNLPRDTNVFIFGMSREGLQEFQIDGNVVQWLPSYRIQGGKSIFVTESNKAITFEGMKSVTRNKTNICLHHEKGVFYLRNSSSSIVPKEHLKQATITEEKMINLAENEGVAIISDSAGCGKSTVMSSLIGHVKGKDGAWAWRCNLSKFCRKVSSLCNIEEDDDVEEVLDDLFLMLGFNNGLEKHLFKTPRERGQCYVFFDAFDELPSEYRRKVLKILATLKEVRDVCLIVTTRMIHRQELEGLLGTHSHQLVPFTREAQVGYLVKLWKNKLKFPKQETSQRDKKMVPKKIKKIVEELNTEKTNLGPEYEGLFALDNVSLENGLDSLRSEIDELDFSKLAEHVLDKASLDDGTFKFMGIPLHLYMIGTVCYEANFKTELYSDIFVLYSQFVERKIEIHLEEKQELKEGSIKDGWQEKLRKDAYRIHIELADQLIDQERVCSVSEMNSEDRQLISNLGIAFIEGESVQFLHHTFAEFFKAKSLERNMRGDVFKKVLLEDKYDGVVVFLSSSLRKESFEKLGEGFLEGENLVVDFMKRIVHKRPFFGRYVSNVVVLCRFKIMKMLLEFFGEKSGIKEMLEEMLSNPKCYDSDGVVYHCIGGCLPVNLLKYLLKRNSKDNSIVLLSFVRYSENHEEVTEVLKEFISLETDGRGLCDAESRKDERLSELRILEDGSREGLLHHALCNDRAEIFPRLLEFFKDYLSGEKFWEEMVQSYEYKREINGFVNSVNFRRIWMLVKELRSVFGDETALLFDDDSKRKMIVNAAKTDISDGATSFLVKVASLLRDCFGVQEWKGLIRSACFVGEDLINVLRKCSSRNMMNYLDVLMKIFDEDDEMKEILKSEIGGSYNLLHLAAFKEDMCFDDLLRFFDDRLVEEEDVKRMLLSPDKYERDVMHYFFTRDFYRGKKTIQNLNVIMKRYREDERFRDLPKNMEKDFNNIFQLSVLMGGDNLEHLLGFCNAHFVKDDIKKIISNEGAYENNFMRCLLWKHSSKTITTYLNQIKVFLNDEQSFARLLKQKWPSRNMFHLAGLRNMYLEDLVIFCYDYLEEREIREMFCSPDEDGHSLIYYSFTHNDDPGTLLNNLYLIRRVLGDDGHFERILNSDKSLFKNLYRLAALNDPYLNDILVNT